MKNRFDFAIVACAVCVGGYAAVVLACTAYYLGFSPLEIRRLAMSAAVFLATLIAIEFFGKKLGKAK